MVVPSTTLDPVPMDKKDELKTKKIGVLLGGLSEEREVSLASGGAVLAALLRRGYRAEAIDVDAGVCARLQQEGVEVAFVVLHGTLGEDGCIQGLLETMRLPYTGSGVQASAMAMDKPLCKALFAAAGLATAPWSYPTDPAQAEALGLPVVVKPRREGSSVGLTVVREAAGLPGAIARAGDAMAERYVGGHELSVGVLGHGAGARVLGSVEIRPAEGLYDYAAKYDRDDTLYLVPAPLPAEVRRQIEHDALCAHRLLECRGATRTDFRWEGEGPAQILELNTIPGMTDHSLLPKVAAEAGLSYDDLVEQMLLGASLDAKVAR